MSEYRRSTAEGATYFFTVALADRRSVALVTQIETLRMAMRTVKARRPFDIVAICILPDHLHTVWTLPPDDADFSARWKAIKGLFSKALPANETRSDSKRAKREKGIWQRRFWEHQVRDETALQRVVDYVHFNPVKHGVVSRVQDWPYSSFHRYVERGWLNADWGDEPTLREMKDAGFGPDA